MKSKQSALFSRPSKEKINERNDEAPIINQLVHSFLYIHVVHTKTKQQQQQQHEQQ